MNGGSWLSALALLVSPADDARPAPLARLVSAARTPASESFVLPLSVCVAQEEGADVKDAAWIDEQVAAAESLFGEHRVHFEVVARRKLEVPVVRAMTRADRDALAAALEPGRINVFVVAQLRDVDDPTRDRFGVMWRKLDDLTKRYVILSAASPRSVLAHEIGHYLGNPHSPVPDNVMSYSRTGGVLFFDAAQVDTIHRTARELIAAKRLVPIQGR